jgi:hypothetical protein
MLNEKKQFCGILCRNVYLSYNRRRAIGKQFVAVYRDKILGNFLLLNLGLYYEMQNEMVGLYTSRLKNISLMGEPYRDAMQVFD